MEGTNETKGLVDVNFELIAWLIDEVKPENTSRLASINTFLRAKFATTIDNLSPGQGASSTRILEILKQEGMRPLATNLSGTAYIDECRAVGVPTPPDWGSSQWGIGLVSGIRIDLLSPFALEIVQSRSKADYQPFASVSAFENPSCRSRSQLRGGTI